MEWLGKILAGIFRLQKADKEHETDRYSPGTMDRYFSRDLEQPAEMFKKAFGNHNYDEEQE